MKCLYLIVVASCLIRGVGQGTIYFANLVPGSVNAPVFDADGTTRLAGDSYLAQLFAGLPGSGMPELAPVGLTAPFGTGFMAGYWDASPEPRRILDFVAPQELAVVQVRIWESRYGSSWSDVIENHPEAPVGLSYPDSYRVGTWEDPAYLVDLNSAAYFSLPAHMVPEPSQIWLILAALAGVWYREKRRASRVRPSESWG